MKLAFLRRTALSGKVLINSLVSFSYTLKRFLIQSGLILFLGFFSVFCIEKPDTQLAQGLRGTIVPISDLTKLECVLTTGHSREDRVNWTKAQRVNLEQKSSGQYEKITFGGNN